MLTQLLPHELLHAGMAAAKRFLHAAVTKFQTPLKLLGGCVLCPDNPRKKDGWTSTVSGRMNIGRRYRALSTLNLVVALLAAATIAILVGRFAADAATERLRSDVEETLAVQTEILTGLLDRHRLAAGLISRHPELPGIFSRQDREAAATLARRVAGYSGGMSVNFLFPDGSLLDGGIREIIDPLPADSELIAAPLQGRLGRAVRLLDNNELAYVFTSGIRNAGQLIGIAAVYVSLDEIQAAWSLSANPILSVSHNGLVIISNRDSWQQQPLGTFFARAPGGEAVLTENGTSSAVIYANRELPLLGWTLLVLADSGPAELARTFWAGLSVLGVAILATASQAYISRQYEFQRRLRSDKATALRLERVVRDRTRELSRANTSLLHEIDERRAAEDELRRTQSELVQTGKLAALGQMSTALAHEYNQPLAAIKSYADNATTLIDRGRTDEARENLTLISSLTDRMADIARHLRNFARKPNAEMGVVCVDDVIRDAQTVVAARARRENAQIVFEQPPGSLLARAGHVRLQQVLVNLIMNALDAMQDNPEKIVTLSCQKAGGKIMVSVADSGPGISADVAEKLFDPFFTTKPVGQGLGLGLSISYNIIKDFGGSIKATNDADGGACFVITLPAARKSRDAAE